MLVTFKKKNVDFVIEPFISQIPIFIGFSLVVMKFPNLTNGAIKFKMY